MKVHTCQQYSEDYWKVRRGIPSASCFDNIITPTGKPSEQSHKYVCSLIADRLSPLYGQQEEYVSASMRNGTIMEPEARRYYEFEREMKVEQVGFCITDDGRFGVSPDALVNKREGTLELKNPDPKTHVEWLLAGVLPPKHKPQVHGALIVTGCDWADFMSYSPGLPPLLVRVVADEYTEQLRAALEVFWTRYQEAWRTVVAMPGAVLPDSPTTTDEDEAAACFVPGGRR